MNPGGETLGEFLRSHKEEVLPRWLEAVRDCTPAVRLPEDELVDHLPVVLDQIATATDHIVRGEWAKVPSDQAVRHAMQRLAAGLDVRDVVTEFFLLRHVLLSFVLGRRPAADPIDDAQLLSWAVDAAIRESVAAFVVAKQRTLKALDRIAEEALTRTTMDELISGILRTVLDAVPQADVACLFVPEGDRLVHRGAVGRNPNGHRRVTLRIGEGVAGQAFAERRPVAVETTEGDASQEGTFFRAEGLRAQYGVPLLVNDAIIGVIQMGSASAYRFEDQDAVLLRAAGDRIAAAIYQAQLRDRARELGDERDRVLEQRQLALDAAGMGWWHLDLAANLATFDARTAELFEFEGSSIPNDQMLARMLPEDLPGVLAALDAALDPTGRRLFTAEYRIRRRDGGTRWISAYARAIGADDSPPRVTALVGALSDVTERKLAEQRLREAMETADLERRRLAAVFAALPAAVAIADARGAVGAYNEAFTRLWGEEPPRAASIEDYARYKGYWTETGELVRPEDWGLSRALATGEVVSGQVIEIEPFDGSGRRTVLNSAAPIKGATGEVVGGVVAAVDITAQRRAEEAVRERERRFRVLIENLFSGVALIGADGTFEVVNDRFFTMFGFARGHPITNLLSEEWASWRVLDERGRPLDVEEHPVRAAFRWKKHVRDVLVGVQRPEGGEIVWMLISAEPILAPDGNLENLIGTFVDVTARRHLEDELRAADRRKNEFLGMLSHELRNPLSPIRNSLYILARVAPDSEQARRAHAVIGRQVHHLTRLVDDLLDVTRITRGKIRIQRERLDLSELVRRAVEDHRGELGNVRTEVVLPDAPVWVDGDPTRLGQVVDNLLGNATKFTQNGGTVSVRLGSASGRAVLEVEDTGVGIDAETLTRLFEPFAQADRSLDRSRGGLGLGLSLVKGLVELHGGRVSAHSEGPGRGARFVVQLPLASRPAVEEPSHADVSGGHGVRRVLVVEDNRDAAESLAEVLGMAGHDVAMAFDGNEAVDRAMEFRPEVVVCDLGLPGMDGYEVASTLRTNPVTASAYLVALSGYAQPEDRRRALEAGFDVHLAKPPDLDELDRVVAGAPAQEEHPSADPLH